MKYIALLRGINVSGQKLIKMEALRKSLERLPFTDVSTYIQSGNILFTSDISDKNHLRNLLLELIKSEFGFDVPVIVITPEDLKQVIENNPYSNRELPDPAQPYVAFLSDTPSKSAITDLKSVDFGKDEWLPFKNWLYLLYESAARTKLSNALIEKRLKVTSTARNWKTVHKLLELSLPDA